MKKKKVFKEIERLKQENEAFSDLVLRADKAIMNFIEEKNRSKSYRPRTSKTCKLKVTVKAIPLTGEELEMFERYLEKKYVNEVMGNWILVKKVPFQKLYKITSDCWCDD